MKKIVLPILTILLAVGCSTIEDLVGGMSPGAVSGAMSGGAASGAIDFKADEILAAANESNLIDNIFYVAKVLTSGSESTKNQSEVLFVGNGEKQWSIATIPSHKASKDELTLDRVVFYSDFSTYEELTEDRYRKRAWRLGRISSVDELFKDVLEVNGTKMFVKWMRIPEASVE